MGSWPGRIPVLVPVYNHVSTIAAVVAGLRVVGAPWIVVVDDGSTDGSGAAAVTAGADAVLTLPTNCGKGAALQSGLKHLSAAGWTCALTCDADLQHPAREALRLAIAADSDLCALWLGRREMSAAPRASRIGRFWTGFATWAVCGQWTVDNQTGLRVYPLPTATMLPIRAGRYAYEVESCIRAVWAGITVRDLTVAVAYPTDRISHFVAWRDSWRATGTVLRLFARRWVPWPHAQANGQGAWATTWRTGTTPGTLAAAVGVGVAIGIAPIPGFHLLISAWLAVTLRLNLGVTALASNISFGPLLAVWFAAEIALGHALRTGHWPNAEMVRGLDPTWAALRPWLGDWCLGALVLMPLMGILAGVVTWLAAKTWCTTMRSESR